MQMNQTDYKLSLQIHWDVVWHLEILDFTWKHTNNQCDYLLFQKKKRTEQLLAFFSEGIGCNKM